MSRINTQLHISFYKIIVHLLKCISEKNAFCVYLLLLEIKAVHKVGAKVPTFLPPPAPDGPDECGGGSLRWGERVCQGASVAENTPHLSLEADTPVR